MAGAHKAPAGLAVGPRPAALSGAAGCYQPGGGVRGWENSWAARDLGYRRTLVLRRRLLLRAVLGAVVAFVARPLRPL